MKRLICVTTAALLLAGTPVHAAQRGTPHAKPRKHDDERAARRKEKPGDDRTRVAVHVAWGARDVELVRTYFAPQYRGRRLPPGLAKKYARTGQLPPGWQKKMDPIPIGVERQLAPLPPDHRRGVIDGVAVIYDARGVIIDVAMLF